MGHWFRPVCMFRSWNNSLYCPQLKRALVKMHEVSLLKLLLLLNLTCYKQFSWSQKHKLVVANTPPPRAPPTHTHPNKNLAHNSLFSSEHLMDLYLWCYILNHWCLFPDQVLRFLYSNAATIKIHPFTIDELAHAFTDKVILFKFWLTLEGHVLIPFVMFHTRFIIMYWKHSYML